MTFILSDETDILEHKFQYNLNYIYFYKGHIRVVYKVRLAISGFADEESCSKDSNKNKICQMNGGSNEWRVK